MYLKMPCKNSEDLEILQTHLKAAAKILIGADFSSLSMVTIWLLEGPPVALGLTTLVRSWMPLSEARTVLCVWPWSWLRQ